MEVENNDFGVNQLSNNWKEKALRFEEKGKDVEGQRMEVFSAQLESNINRAALEIEQLMSGIENSSFGVILD